MKATNPHNFQALQRQIKTQLNLRWDLETSVPWGLGVDVSKGLLPLDDDCVAFPGASDEQRVVLSQLMGLIVNATISEMEDALPKLKLMGWEKLLADYPANPEIRELGEMFFDEEEKHALAFKRYFKTFCDTQGIDPVLLRSFLPSAHGTHFQKWMTQNAVKGGQAFWWLVASVEEISIDIFHAMKPYEATIDPLYFQLHRLHMEEESRHANYAYLMLELARSKPQSIKDKLFSKIDFAISQIAGTPWVLGELSKIKKVKDVANEHPFFEVLASCLPLIESMSKKELFSRFFIAAPYISWYLNPRTRKRSLNMIDSHGAWSLPYPKPKSTSQNEVRANT